MFVDLEAVRHGAKRYQVIIVGSGPAGMSLALDLERQGIDCLLVEAGGHQYPEAEGLDPYQGVVEGRPYPLHPSRLRFLGGTSGHWGGWVRPLDPWDFEAREGDDIPSWPISHDEAYSRLDRCNQVLEIESAEYEAPSVLKELAPKALDLADSKDFQSAVFRFSPPTRFGFRYRPALDAAKHADCLIHTSLVRVERDAEGRSRMHFVHRSGERFALQADRHVLAMGGIENARFLAWSREAGFAGLGGEGDWIGRCFADHVGLSPALVLTRTQLDYERQETPLGPLMSRVVPTAARVRAGEVNHMFALSPRRGEESIGGNYGTNPSIFGADSSRLMHYSLIAVAEQRPLRESRVLLSKTRDRLDVPRVELHWEIDDRDFRDLIASTERLGRWLAASGRGRLKRTAGVPERDAAVSVGMHHMGTTRMAREAAWGVVDQDCKVFGSRDLYVAGSSVFARYGYANPTLTIVCLALRLADHLAKTLKVSP